MAKSAGITQDSASASEEQYKKMAAIITRYAKDGKETTFINGLFISMKIVTDKPLYLAQWPCIAMVVQGSKSVTFGQDTINYGVGDYLLVTLDLPVISRVTKASASEPNLGIGIRIDPDRLNPLLNRISNPTETISSHDIKGIVVHKAPLRLIDAITRYLELLDHPEDIDALSPLIEEEIYYHILTGPYGGQLLRFANEDNPANKISKAVKWLRDNYKETLKVSLLSRDVGMSESSLHHHFKTITSMTPMQYQKQLRLHEARKLMLIDNLGANEAGYEVGYQSAAQFSREYSRMYGNSPLRDVSMLKTNIRNTP
ncbi:MAG: AraC family transcriptional regulator [Flavitalea sp.]